MTVDREKLWEALEAFSIAFNADGPDRTLRHATRLMAPILSQILQDDADELAADVKSICDGIFQPEAGE